SYTHIRLCIIWRLSALLGFRSKPANCGWLQGFIAGVWDWNVKSFVNPFGWDLGCGEGRDVFEYLTFLHQIFNLFVLECHVRRFGFVAVIQAQDHRNKLQIEDVRHKFCTCFDYILSYAGVYSTQRETPAPAAHATTTAASIS